MAGVDRKIKHYHTNHDTGERTLNTDFNIFIILNGIAYIIMLVLVFTVGAFGAVTNTTYFLGRGLRSLVTMDEIFFKVAWGFILPWQGFWVVWQIANPSERNCEGVVRAAYYYPLATLLYGGYTISCRAGMFVSGAVFCFLLCGCLVGLAMSMQKYRAKIWKGYFLWQGPLTLYAAWIMVETMLMTNAIFVRLGEDWIIKVVVASISLLVIFITAIAWLSSYPVDLLIPFVLMCAVGGIYLEMKDMSHYGELIRQDYSNTLLEGWKWGTLVMFGLIALAFIIKVIVVLLYHRPKDQEERKKKKESRVSVSITIDTGNNNNNNNNNKGNKNRSNRHNDRQWNNNRRAPDNEYADDYYGNNYDNEYGTHYDNEYGDGYDDGYHNDHNKNGYRNDYDNYNSPPSTPVQKPKKKSSRKNGDRSASESPRKSPRKSPKKSPTKSPKKSVNSPTETPKKKRKKKTSSPKSPAGTEKTSATSMEDDDSMV